MFSSIWLAVILLSLVTLYGILASIPVGVVALAPTYAFYAVTLLFALGIGAVVPAIVAKRIFTPRMGPAAAFVLSLVLFLTLGATMAWLWGTELWPQLQYDPATGRGIIFFREFCDRTRADTLRRIPGMEMSELEFYGWWPLKVILIAFVVNMMTATVRRIEFTFKNIGVLTVHTGIVTIALGSVYYNGSKLEGDTLLQAGEFDQSLGQPALGPIQNAFYDNTRVALHISQGNTFEQRLIPGLPRYNDYNLKALGVQTAGDASGERQPWDVPEANSRLLSIPLSGATDPRTDRDFAAALRKQGIDDDGVKRILAGGVAPGDVEGDSAKLRGLPPESLRELFRRTMGRDLSFRVIGYAKQASLVQDFVKLDPADIAPGTPATPLRFVNLYAEGGASLMSVVLDPSTAAARQRVIDLTSGEGNGIVSIEYTRGESGGMSPQRWRDLAQPVPPSSPHTLIVEIPTLGAGTFRVVRAVRAGETFAVEGTGFSIMVKQLLSKPEFPLITKGYENADSSVVKVVITPPASLGQPPYERWVYSRFPEISQDFLEEKNERGMPKRRAADPSIRVAYIDAANAAAALYVDEAPDGSIRGLSRLIGGEVKVVEGSGSPTKLPQLLGPYGLAIADRWEHSRGVERPAPIPEDRADPKHVGTHDEALIAVEVTLDSATKGPAWSRVVWLPFRKYVEEGDRDARTVEIPDGRRLTLSFGRLRHALPDMWLRLRDFEMIAYDHRGSPRDYRSRIVVESPTGAFETFEHDASLNYPLTAPFMVSDRRGMFGNFFGSIRAGLNPRQFKFSQAGWDMTGWRQTQQMVDAGQLKKPFVHFTIMQVGNNPGIHVIALGAIFMGVGIPWAFYVKPWLVRREKARIQRELAAGTYVKPGGAHKPSTQAAARAPAEVSS
ncbi:MAG: hypothetical protein AABZ53_02585 [Planctomycetota bacterium]